jgi:hypothetical protein
MVPSEPEPMMMTKRKPRQPRQLSTSVAVIPAKTRTNLPAHYHDAEVALMLTDLVKRHAHSFTPEASSEAFEAFFIRRLLSPDIVQSSMDAIYITGLARAGHPSADGAIRKAIIAARRLERSDELPLAVKAFGDEITAGLRDPVGPYSPNTSGIIDNYVRNLAIGGIVEVLLTKFPFLPKWTSAATGQRSAKDLVGIAFGLSEMEIYRIHKKHRKIPALVRDFFREHSGL